MVRSTMNPDAWRAVDAHFTSLLLEPDPVLDSVLKASAAAGLPDIQVSPPLGKFLHLLAKMSGARRILELGTLAGYSGIWLARALPEDGRLVTLEAEPAHAEVARANFRHAGVDLLVDLRVGPALESLPRLEEEGEGPFDFIFLDADKEGYPGYLPWLLRLSRPGTVIVADNVVRGGTVVDPDDPDPRVRGVRRFTEQLAAEPRLTSTVVQTVGSKGYDGFVLATVQAVAP